MKQGTRNNSMYSLLLFWDSFPVCIDGGFHIGQINRLWAGVGTGAGQVGAGVEAGVAAGS